MGECRTYKSGFGHDFARSVLCSPLSCVPRASSRWTTARPDSTRPDRPGPPPSPPPPLSHPLPAPCRYLRARFRPNLHVFFFLFLLFFFTIPAIQRNEKPRFIHERWIDSLFCPFRGQWSRPVIRYFGLRLFNRFSTDFFALAEADDPNCGRVRIFSLFPPLPSLPSMQRSIKWGFTTRSRCNSIYSRQSRTDNKFNG